jgi:hypothetical protein
MLIFLPQITQKKEAAMIRKKIINPDRIRGIKGGFSFIPHRFITDGFFPDARPVVQGKFLDVEHTSGIDTIAVTHSVCHHFSSCDHSLNKYSSTKCEEWIIVKKEYQTGFTGLYR